MKQLLAIIFFIAVSNAIANPMCVSFCEECLGKESTPTCLKVDSTCGNCKAILDSVQIEKERIAKELEQKRIEEEKALALKQTLTNQIADSVVQKCENSFCAFEIYWNQNQIKAVKAVPLPMKKDSLTSYLKTQTTNDTTQTTKDSSESIQKSDTIPENIPPMNQECQNFCQMCPDDSTNAKQDSMSISMCAKIEAQCQCKYHAEILAQQEEQKRIDSLKAIEERLLYLETAKIMGQKIYESCSTPENCSTLVTIRKKNLDIVEFRNIPVKVTPKPVVKKDTLLPPKQTPPPPPTNKPLKPKNLKENKKEKTFYSGISLNIGDVDRQSYFEDFDENEDGIIGGIGYLARWYFYSAGSFQLGINALVESVTLAEAEYSHLDFNVDQISLVAEIPIELRFGIPLSEYFAPFVSFSLNARKYIYGWFKYEMENSWLYNDATEDGFYESGDIDFLYFLGIGIEITKHFAIQYQWLISGIGWRSGYDFNYDEDCTNRFSMDFAF
jgi:hypothetical protein